MKAKRIDHVAIAVQDLDAALLTYQQHFGLEKVSSGEVPSLGIRNAFLQIGEAQLELITPLTAQGPVADFLAQHGGGMYLLALEVEDLDDAIATLQAQGARVNIATGSGGRRLAFVSPRATHGVLLQLLERRPA
ncbi:MAG: VOC family protein [Candidatus Tectimicrobiota bacterium]